jgi:AAA+ superfamily predicted ATPase
MIDQTENIIALEQELDWLEEVINQSIASYLLQEGHENNWFDIPLPSLESTNSALTQFVNQHQLNQLERLTLALSFAPNIRPNLLDIFFGKNQLYDRPFSEFGGITNNEFSGFIPTVQTLLFIATAAHPTLRVDLINVLAPKSTLRLEQVIEIQQTPDHVPSNGGAIKISENYLHYFLTGIQLHFEHSPDFPAHKIETPLDWQDVVLDDLVQEQIAEIQTWLEHGQSILDEWKLNRKIKPGYRSLFYGPPGTGKTLTATLLGKANGRDVYRIDLSMIVSKYIGETEKNLAKVFDIAQHKDWILFFDEADSLFGKRTNANSSNDRHANQQTGYLLQRIEDYPGVVILASNLRDNIDAAFTRRFQSMVHFKMPDVEERFILWKNAFSDGCVLDSDIDLYQLASTIEISGGAIINVLRSCAISAAQRKSNVVTKLDLLNAIRKEFSKEHKTINSDFL